MGGKLKGVMAISIAGGLIAGACFGLVSTPGVARPAQHSVSVNRTNKGDRLPLKHTSAVSWAVAVKARLPVGCDPAFSRVADPARAHIFGRCIS